MKKPNALIHETSPYLLQHAYNPVNWFPWKEETLLRAQLENKLLIVSIGYSACHWCHVMERESFEDEEVAGVMNTYYISIKVDREERPDVDQVYMDAVQLISGRGGWPLNAICLPDGRPVFAGTYFPKHQWLQILRFFAQEFQKNPSRMYEQAEALTHHIQLLDNFLDKQDEVFNDEDNIKAAENLLSRQDPEYGGNTGAPKFPMPVNYFFLLQHYLYSHDKKILQAVLLTLDKMMYGGIYDQVGGGFARYAVDERWEIPHFEKMLYDNAQLVSLYAHAYQITGDKSYLEVVNETLQFILSELTGEHGNFYSALDADSEGEEGKYYVWKYDELKTLLGEDFDDFKQIFNVPEHGNFEGLIHLTRKEKNILPAEKIRSWKQILLQQRRKRIPPGLDDKTLTAWNALMLKGFADAYLATGNDTYLKAALQNALFIKNNLLDEKGLLYRTYKNEKRAIQAFLDDFAFLIEAYLSLYDITFQEEWLKLALQLSNYTLENFFDKEKNVFFYTDKTGEKLIVRKSEKSDNVIPSSNSVMAKNLFRLGILTENENFITTSKKMIAPLKKEILQHTPYYANWASLMRWITDEPFVIAISGKEPAAARLAFGRYYTPDCFFVAGDSELIPSLSEKKSFGEPIIYICREKSCTSPFKNVEDAMNYIKEARYRKHANH